ncbi:hypothetical protein CRYUN_Cryun01aG0066800 [Craigia yunnanensis]
MGDFWFSSFFRVFGFILRGLSDLAFVWVGSLNSGGGFQNHDGHNWWENIETYNLGHRIATLPYRVITYNDCIRGYRTNLVPRGVKIPLMRAYVRGCEKPSPTCLKFGQRKSSSTLPIMSCIKILAGNKVDWDSERAVTREEGMALAQEHSKTKENVHQCFKDLILKILQVPALLEKGSAVVKK